MPLHAPQPLTLDAPPASAASLISLQRVYSATIAARGRPSTMKPPQALNTSYSTRVHRYYTALVAPPGGIVAQPPERRTKRGTATVNYAEHDVDDDRDASGDPRLTSEVVDPSAPPERAHAPVDAPSRPVQLLRKPHRADATLAAAAALPTVLIPIRLDLDLDKGRLHDTFLWNLHEMLITPEEFAQQMVTDLGLAGSSATAMTATIAATIRDQLAEYAPVAQISLPESSGEMRAVCNLVINHDQVQYIDRFEWDLTNAALPPETFARRIAADLGLRSEFVPAIAAGIYEFSLQKKKDLYEGSVPELEVFAQRQDGTDAGWRLDNEGLCTDWEPKVELLTREEIEKREIDREREVRRLRRETARFGTGPVAGTDEAGGELGRGGRGRVRKRQRSASPTPQGVENDWERSGWRCRWCGISGKDTWGAGDGPEGVKVSFCDKLGVTRTQSADILQTLCWNCSNMYREKGKLEGCEWAKNLHGTPIRS